MNRVRFHSYIIFRPILFLILLGSSCLIFFKLCSLTKKLESNLVSKSNEVRGKIFSDIRHSEKFVVPLNSSAANLARILSSYLNGKQITFSIIEREVAPQLFLLLSTIPYVSEVSYTGLAGLSFWYYMDDDQIFAVYSNTTSSSVHYYSQKVNLDSGKLYGQAMAFNSSYKFSHINSLQMPIAHSSLGIGLNPDNLLFKTTVLMENGRGVISVGSKAQVISDLLSSIDFLDSFFFLASNDGRQLIGTKLPNSRIVVTNGTLSVRTIDRNLKYKVVNYSCHVNGAELRQFSLKINRKDYIVYCSTMEYGGVKLVYSLAFPSRGMESVARNITNLTITLLVLLLVIIVISISVFIILILKATRRQMFLCAALIKQMESTQQAERKSMNKSMAFANASHDVRGSLAAITGLIEVCREDVNPNSDLASNLRQIHTSATDVLGILNSVLDTSKIEAGKMQLEVEEFDLGQVLDEVVDTYYPLGLRKGIDVILDPCDGSILKYYHVKGDRGKFKQILCNLLSNAIKFTSEGHIVVRVTVRKPSKANAIIASNSSSGVLNHLTRFCYKSNGTFSSVDELHPVQEDPNCMEFLFDVEDTGTGIPKEKQKSVFENFVQVKETAFGQEGCGLGLGIVQSLVRLMGGEIQIVDKEHREKGSCFRFNIFLTCTTGSTETDEPGNHIHSSRNFGLHIRSPTPRSEGSHVILLLAGEERRKISSRVMESFGIKVSVAKKSKDLLCILEMIKQKMDSLQCSSPELSPGSSSSSPHKKSYYTKRPVNFLLIIMDANTGPVTELFPIVSSFIQETPSIRSKVVWLENPITRGDNSGATGEKRSTPPCDYIMSRPFHGSRLYQILGLLPEFANDPLKFKATVSPVQENQYLSEVLHSSNNGNNKQLQEIIIHHENTPKKNPLEGKSVLVVEDTPVLCKIATAILQKLGAKVDVCVDGKEAVDLVCKVLRDQEKKTGNQKALPFDFIFMDCEMPVMSGYEAARQIRMEEKSHGIHIPIFALTAHAMAETTSKVIDAGMDFHLSKPLKVDKLLDAIRLFLNLE